MNTGVASVVLASLCAACGQVSDVPGSDASGGTAGKDASSDASAAADDGSPGGDGSSGGDGCDAGGGGYSYLDHQPDGNYPDSSGAELTDGDTTTGTDWVNGVGFLDSSLAPTGYATIEWDLGCEQHLSELDVWVANANGEGDFAVYRPDVSVQLSPDGTSWNGVGAMSYGDVSGSAGSKNQTDLLVSSVNSNARYVRFAVYPGEDAQNFGDSWAILLEIEKSN